MTQAGVADLPVVAVCVHLRVTVAARGACVKAGPGASLITGTR